MVVPVFFVSLGATPNLHESGAAFAEASGEETATAKIFGGRVVCAVGLVNMFWFA